MKRLQRAGLFGVLSVGLACVAPAVGGEPLDPVAAPGEIRGPQQLLIALERVDDKVDTLQAAIQYDRRFVLQGDQHVRRGKLFYRAERDADGAERVRPKRAFEIDFKDLWLVGAQRKEEDRQIWVFDGHWLIEKRPHKKQYIAREIAAPGEDFDPLSIKEGIMPIPIGQRAADVLERFDVELVEANKGLDGEPSAMVTFVGDCYQLRLTPKEEFTEDSKFTEIRLWYEKEALMPRMSRAVDQKGDVSFVQLLDVKRNERLPRGVIAVSPPPENEGWDIQVERRRETAGVDQ